MSLSFSANCSRNYFFQKVHWEIQFEESNFIWTIKYWPSIFTRVYTWWIFEIFCTCALILPIYLYLFIWDICYEIFPGNFKSKELFKWRIVSFSKVLWLLCIFKFFFSTTMIVFLMGEIFWKIKIRNIKKQLRAIILKKFQREGFFFHTL